MSLFQETLKLSELKFPFSLVAPFEPLNLELFSAKLPSSLEVKLHLELGEKRTFHLEVFISGYLSLLCARCGLLFEYPIQAHVQKTLQESESKEENIFLLMPQKTLNLRQLIEEEVSFLIEDFPMHTPEKFPECAAYLQEELEKFDALDDKKSMPSPFQALKGMKLDSSQSKG